MLDICIVFSFFSLLINVVKSLEEVNISYNIENFVDESSTYHVLDDEFPKSEVFDLNIEVVDYC
jgi:hypothetical protein